MTSMVQVHDHTKLYIVTRQDLPLGLQAAQMVHVAIEFSLEYPELTTAWHRDSNYVVCLSVEDLFELEELHIRLGKKFITVPFYEPDLDNEMTAFAIEPHPDVERQVSSIALALTQSL